LDALTATPLVTTSRCAPVNGSDAGVVLDAWLFVFVRSELAVTHDRETGDLLVHVSAASRRSPHDDWCATDTFDARVTGRGVVLDHAPDAGRIALVEGLIAAYRSRSS
jgi:hypothetical protein